MPPRPSDPRHGGQDERDQPYQGKHRAPESKLRGLGRSLANLALDQPTTARHPLPDAPGSDSSEDHSDQQAVNGQQSAHGLGESSPGLAKAPCERVRDPVGQPATGP
jgi:hypothetical protein